MPKVKALPSSPLSSSSPPPPPRVCLVASDVRWYEANWLCDDDGSVWAGALPVGSEGAQPGGFKGAANATYFTAGTARSIWVSVREQRMRWRRRRCVRDLHVLPGAQRRCCWRVRTEPGTAVGCHRDHPGRAASAWRRQTRALSLGAPPGRGYGHHSATPACGDRTRLDHSADWVEECVTVTVDLKQTTRCTIYLHTPWAMSRPAPSLLPACQRGRSAQLSRWRRRLPPPAQARP
jgi:hypothetical protein